MKKIRVTLFIVSFVAVIMVFFWIGKPAPRVTVAPVATEATSTLETTEVTPEENVIEITAEKPASFDGVEMVTYQNPHGFEITYPKEWVGRLAPENTSPAVLEYYIYPEEIPYGPSNLLQIEMYNKSLEVFMERQGNKDLQPIIIGGQRGYLQPIGSVGTKDYRYIFLTENGFYGIIMRDSKSFNASDAEALWILSTFKITE